MAEKKGQGSCYIGRIGNTGTQRVEAPVKPAGKSGKSTVKKGDDLRK